MNEHTQEEWDKLEAACAAMREFLSITPVNPLNEWFEQRDKLLCSDCGKALLEELQQLRSDNDWLKRFHMRITNESADFHIKECQRLREELEQLRADKETYEQALGIIRHSI